MLMTKSGWQIVELNESKFDVQFNDDIAKYHQDTAEFSLGIAATILYFVK